MMVTTGGRGNLSLGVPSSDVLLAAISFAFCSSKLITFVSAPKKRAISLANSVSSVWLIVAKTPRSNNLAIKSFARISSFSAKSLTLMPSLIVIVRVMGIGSFESDGRGGGCSPSSGLLLRHVVHSVAPVSLKELPGDSPAAAMFRRRRCRPYAKRTRTCRRLPRRMHRAPFAGTQRRTRRSRWEAASWARPLKNRLTGHRPSRSRAHS